MSSSGGYKARVRICTWIATFNFLRVSLGKTLYFQDKGLRVRNLTFSRFSGKNWTKEKWKVLIYSPRTHWTPRTTVSCVMAFVFWTFSKSGSLFERILFREWRDGPAVKSPCRAPRLGPQHTCQAACNLWGCQFQGTWCLWTSTHADTLTYTIKRKLVWVDFTNDSQSLRCLGVLWSRN